MKPHIAVIGDLMIDHYLWGKSDRISPEAPVPVVEIEKETSTLGGAGNVVSNLISLGADVTVFSVVGDDEIANQLVKLLENIGAKHFLVMDEKRKTSKKSRIIASHQQVIRYDKESKTPIDTKHEKELIKALFTSVHTFDLILISDYNKGVVTKSLIEKINFVALGTNLKVLADPKGSDFSKYLGCYLLTPNKKEASLATNIDIVDDDSLYQALKKLHNIAALQIPLITLSEDGIAFLDENSNLIKKPTVAKEVFDVTGAGDTVLAALGIMLAQNKNINDAVSFANLAAGVVVGKIGSATVNMQEIEEYKLSLHQSSVENKIQSFNKISNTISFLKQKNKKIVFTNGCFDILHKGHASYLNQAKKLGDILIVGLNSDDSVKRLKGKNRPINTQEDRAYILASLEAVDYVVIFDEDTPYSLIKIIKPDILVKGADYKNKQVVGSDIAKEVKLIEFVDGKSTTNLINQIQKRS